ncbi:MAG: sensor histidine kinase, partial [Polynucleobacter victoriensis]
LLDMFNRLKTANSNVQFNLNVNFSKKSEDVELAIYRVAQEAINNALKHAKPSQIDVNLDETSDSIKLSIRNDGQSPNQLSNTGHFGIEGMQERAHFLGGELSFEIRPSGGLIVELKIPNS